MRQSTLRRILLASTGSFAMLVAGSISGSAFDMMNVLLLDDRKAQRRPFGRSCWGRHGEQRTGSLEYERLKKDERGGGS